MQGYLFSRPLPLHKVEELLINEQAATEIEFGSTVALAGGLLETVRNGSTNGSAPSNSIDLGKF
jgi:hypothetical protein